MLRFLFWNTNGKPVSRLVADLARTHASDLVILAEPGCGEADLAAHLNSGGDRTYEVSSVPSGKFVLASSFPGTRLQPLRDDRHVCVRRLHTPRGTDLLLVIVHLRSKLYQRDYDQAFAATRLPLMIAEDEARAGHSRTIVVGDLNMDPFEPGVCAAATLHGVMSRQVARRTHRIVGAERRPFFYNPMWSLYGDLHGTVPGTYYLGGSSELTYFWHMFDQVLIRPQLAQQFQDRELAILTRVGDIPLVTKQGVPNRRVGSDHLPITFALDV